MDVDWSSNSEKYTKSRSYHKGSLPRKKPILGINSFLVNYVCAIAYRESCSNIFMNSDVAKKIFGDYINDKIDGKNGIIRIGKLVNSEYSTTVHVDLNLDNKLYFVNRRGSKHFTLNCDL